MKILKGFPKSVGLDHIFLMLTGVLIIMGSVGVFKAVTIPLCLAVNSFYLAVKLIKNKKITLPDTYGLYMIFIIALFVHTLLFNGEIIFFWMFLSGGLFWVSIYNCKILAGKFFPKFLTALGILMALLFICFRTRGVTSLSPDNLFLPLQDWTIHNHIGDLWAIISVVLVFRLAKKLEPKELVLFFIGLVIIALSSSRSAVISLAAGIIFLINRLQTEGKLKIQKKHANILAVAAIGIFSALLIYFGIRKPTLTARPYFMEAIMSIFKRPLGIGMGNFATVSPETNIVHNIVLEVEAGMGVFSIIFIIWLYKVFVAVFVKRGGEILYNALALTIFTNFFFDSTYVIPGMLWIFFAVLALI